MVKGKRLWILELLLISVMLVTVVYGCSSSKPASAPEKAAKLETPKEVPKKEAQKEEPKQPAKTDWPTKLTIACGPTSGDNYVKSSAWAAEMGKQLGIKITPESTAGSTVSIRMIEAGQVELVTTGTDILYEAWSGTGDWTEGKKLQNFRAVFTIDPFALQFYALKKSNIKSLNDIEGKSINPSRAASSTDVWVRRIVEELKIKPSKIVNQAPSDANKQLVDGLLDVAAVQGPFPHSAITEVAVLNEINVFGFEREFAEKLVQKYPALSVMECPANTYKGQSNSFTTCGSILAMVVRKELPEDLVYEFTKRTYATKESLAAAHIAFQHLDPKAISQATIPLHKGAAKYYQEVGVNIPPRIAPID